ncbi:3-oxoacyl-[acyl-carrier-protein] reductase FabG [bacterium HR40]|nr:3-oxoacyl-[acyl-carrier-protein] reductase FabG [bacterium HR40]
MTVLAGKAAIVTGGARGVGRGIVQRLAEAGAKVVIADIDGDAAAACASALGRQGLAVEPFAMDVREPQQAEAAVAFCRERFGSLDIFVNNAGRTDRQPFLEMSLSFFEELIRLNLTGYFVCGQAAARAMVAQGRGGRIINISSNSGLFGGRGRAAYGASKAAIVNLTQTMAIELAPYGILVNCIAPGPMRTERTREAAPSPAFTCRMSLPRFGDPLEVGAAAVWLASEACSFTTGHVIGVDGGFTVTGVMEG